MSKSERSKDKGDEIRVRTTPVFKLKDRPTRYFVGINLKKQFGFLPEVIIIEKVRGSNNAFLVRAVMTKEEIEKENKIRSKGVPVIPMREEAKK
jgi:ribosomal protein L19